MNNSNPILIKTCEMHCCGEPVRIVEHGYPALSEHENLLDIRTHVTNKLDHLRRMLMAEPRGHDDMYGAILIGRLSREATINARVLFTNNTGYSPMCGHATIALARYLADKEDQLGGTNRNEQTEREFRIEVPCGIVQTFVNSNGEARFISVEAYVANSDIEIQLPNDLNILVDIAYGGAYYAVVAAEKVGVVFGTTTAKEMVIIGMQIKKIVMETVEVKHPLHSELSFLYGVIFVDDSKLESDHVTKNVTIFAEGQVDRSPTGSGVTARMALLHKNEIVNSMESITFISGVTDGRFTGKIVEETTWCQIPCVKVEVSGKAYYTGKCEFTCELEDQLRFGFNVK